MEQMLRYNLPFAESDCNLHMLEKRPANEKMGRQMASRTMHVCRQITALEARKAVIAAWATATNGAERGCCTELFTGNFVMSRSTNSGMVRLALQPPGEAPVGVTLAHEGGVGRLPQSHDSAKLGRRTKAVYSSKDGLRMGTSNGKEDVPNKRVACAGCLSRLVRAKCLVSVSKEALHTRLHSAKNPLHRSSARKIVPTLESTLPTLDLKSQLRTKN